MCVYIHTNNITQTIFKCINGNICIFLIKVSNSFKHVVKF